MARTPPKLIARLPVELYRPIAQHVHRRRDLAALARTSRLLQIEAERQLYRHIEIWAKNVEDDYRRFQALLNLLISTPRVASYVHSFSWEPVNIFAVINIGPILEAAVNLKRVMVYENVLGLLALTTLKPLLGVTSLKLEFIRFSSMAPICDRDREEFGRHVELKEFEWFYDAKDFRHGGKLTACFPKLKVLTLWGPINARATLLRQTVTHLSHDCRMDVYHGEDVFESVTSLRTYKLFGVRQARHFPNLKYLWAAVVPDIESVHLLPKLEKISFGPVDRNDFLLDWQESILYAKCLLKHSTSLKQVHVHGRHGANGFLPATATLRRDRASHSAMGFMAGVDPFERVPVVKDSDEEEWRAW